MILSHPYPHMILLDDARGLTGRDGIPSVDDVKTYVESKFPQRSVEVNTTSCASRCGGSGGAVRRGEPCLYDGFLLAAPVPRPSHISTRRRRRGRGAAAGLHGLEKSETEEIVVDECRRRAHDDVEHAEAAVALGDCHLRAEGRVAVHVVDVIGEGGVGVVEERVSERA